MLGIGIYALEIAIDAAILVFLLKTINEDDVEFGTAFLVALVTSIGTAILAALLSWLMGVAGVILAAIAAAALLGVAVSALFGVEIKRSFLIAGIFMVANIGVGIGFNLMLRT